MRFLATALAPALLGLAAASAAAQGLMEEAPVPPIDRTSRQAVIDAYRRYYLTSAPPPIEWTGSINPVNPGTTSLAYRKATLQRINWYRRMAGNLPNIVFDPQLNAKCQAGALMISAANMFTPFPPAVIPTTWPAYTPEGAVGAQNSSLGLGASGPQAIDGHMTDYNEPGVGHRLGLLNPDRIRSGTGDVPSSQDFGAANTSWDGLEGAPKTILARYSWPPAGYCVLQEAGTPFGWPRYWSFHVNDSDVNTGGGVSSVEVVKNGLTLTTTKVSAFSWEVLGDRPAHGDVYEVTIRNYYISGVPTTISYRVQPIDPDAPKLINVSTRLLVGRGENVGIAGFVISGDKPRKVLVRALGPSLAAAGVSNPLADPMLELRGLNGALIALNDQWRPSDFDEGGIGSAQLRPGDSRESAIIATLPVGSYTAIVRGVNDNIGVALIEAYDLESDNADASAVNVSTRGRVQDGDAVMIGGFVLHGNKPATVVVRALGPSLAATGVVDCLSDPSLELRTVSGDLVAVLDDTPPASAAELGDLYPLDPREAAFKITLQPGAYTAIVRGKNGSSGVAIVEAYQR